MIVVAIILQLLWIIALGLGGFGVGWTLATLVIKLDVPVVGVVGMGLLYLVLIAVLGNQVGNGIEHLTGY